MREAKNGAKATNFMRIAIFKTLYIEKLSPDNTLNLLPKASSHVLTV